MEDQTFQVCLEDESEKFTPSISSSSSSTHTCTEPFSTLYSGLHSDPGNTFSLFAFLSFSAESLKVLYSTFLQGSRCCH